jgi:hypothetical protein
LLLGGVSAVRSCLVSWFWTFPVLILGTGTIIVCPLSGYAVHFLQSWKFVLFSELQMNFGWHYMQAVDKFNIRISHKQTCLYIGWYKHILIHLDGPHVSLKLSFTNGKSCWHLKNMISSEIFLIQVFPFLTLALNLSKMHLII